MPPSLKYTSMVPTAACINQLQRVAFARTFSSTTNREQRITRARQMLFRWLNSKGQQYRQPAENTTNYVMPIKSPPEFEDNVHPFHLNFAFLSQPILSEEMREDIWSRVMRDGKSVRDVSTALGIEMRRVAAVVRLKEVEKDWIRIVSLPKPVPYILKPS